MTNFNFINYEVDLPFAFVAETVESQILQRTGRF